MVDNRTAKSTAIEIDATSTGDKYVATTSVRRAIAAKVGETIEETATVTRAQGRFIHRGVASVPFGCVTAGLSEFCLTDEESIIQPGGTNVRKLFVAFMGLVLFAATALPAFAQSRSRYNGRTPYYQNYDRSRVQYDRRSDRRRYDRRYRDRSVWDRHRDKLTVAAGTGAGAVIGGLAGGKRGAVIGALLGAGGSALYTYEIRDRRDKRRYSRRR